MSGSNWEEHPTRITKDKIFSSKSPDIWGREGLILFHKTYKIYYSTSLFCLLTHSFSGHNQNYTPRSPTLQTALKCNSDLWLCQHSGLKGQECVSRNPDTRLTYRFHTHKVVKKKAKHIRWSLVLKGPSRNKTKALGATLRHPMDTKS